MKNTLILIFALTTIALGTVCVVQSRKLAALKTETTSLRADAEQQTRELADLQSSQKLLEQQRQELFEQSSQLAAKLQSQPHSAGKAGVPSHIATASATNTSDSDKDKNPLGSLLAKMMDDPETKKMIRQQQRAMLDQLYSPLVKQMGLQPDEAERFKDLLADNMIKGAEKATSLLGGDSSTNRTEMMTKMAEEQKNFDEQVRGFLGESRYAQYKDYQETAGERTQLNQFRQTAGSEGALTDRQTEQLLAFMKEEKQAATGAGGLSSFEGKDAASIQAMLSGEGLEKILQSQETIGQRVYERARTVLSENQLAAFGKFQTNQIQMTRMGMSMARKFMSPENAQGTKPNP